MSNEYTAVKVWVGAIGDEDHIQVQTDTLDGQRGTVRLSIERSKDGDQIIGYFDADQLIKAIQLVANADLSYLMDGDDK